MVNRGTTQQSSAPYTRRIVLDVIRRHGSLSRKDIVDLVALSPQTVANITSDLESVGLVVTRVVEEARARTPTTAERSKLEMAAAGPVWDIVRVFYADDDDTERPVEASTVIAPAARLVLRFETSLSGA